MKRQTAIARMLERLGREQRLIDLWTARCAMAGTDAGEALVMDLETAYTHTLTLCRALSRARHTLERERLAQQALKALPMPEVEI